MGKLKENDRVRIVKMPGEGDPSYYMHKDTKWVFKKLLARGRSVRIAYVDKDEGSYWFSCQFLRRGKIERHYVCLWFNEDIWVKVEKRVKA